MAMVGVADEHHALRQLRMGNVQPDEPRARDAVGVHSGDRRRGVADPFMPRLHERAEVLSEIRHVLATTWEHSACPILIEGSAGAGKTALLNATVKMGAGLGLRVARAQGDVAESSTPFGVTRQLFASMLGQTAIPETPTADGTDLARRVLRVGMYPTDDPLGVYQSLMLLLETICEGPALVGIDDVQWADPMSAGWLQFLARRLNAVSAHLVLTRRPRRVAVGSAATEPRVFHRATRILRLHPLAVHSTSALMNEHFNTSISQPIVAAVHRVTGGNPQLVTRMLSAMDGMRIAVSSITEHHIEALTSPSVAHSVIARVSTLPDGALELLEAAAVLGPVDLRVAAAVAGVEGNDASLLADALADAGALGWERPLQFVHTFERNSVCAEIQPARRARVHASAARILAASGGDATQVATHLLSTEPSDDEWTASVLLEAARRHLESDPLRAGQLLERADREAPANHLRAEVARLRAEVDDRLGRETAVEHLGRAARLGLDPMLLAETALDLLDRRWVDSSSPSILDLLESVRDQLSDAHPHTELRLQLTESVRGAAHTMPRREAHAVESDEAWQASPTGQLLAVQHAVRLAARMQCSHQQLVDTLRPLLTPPLLRCGGMVHAAIITTSLRALVRLGTYELVDPLIRSAMASADTAGQQIEATAYALVMADSLAAQGRLAAAEKALTDLDCGSNEALSQCVAAERRWLASLCEWGDPDSIPLRVVPTMAAPGLAELGGSAAMVLAEITARGQLLEGDWVGALLTLEGLRSAAEQASVRNPSFTPWRVGRCLALAGLGRHDQGRDLADENLEAARTFGSPITIAQALACVARFRPPEIQVALLVEAREAIAGTTAELLRCSLNIDLGLAAIGVGDRSAARATLREAADHAIGIGATRLAGAAGRGLLACGTRPRRLHLSGVQSLTPSELRVARLAAERHTNGSIAASLFINLKTVESHLTRAYKKLGIKDRADLTTALAAHPVDILEVPRAG